MPGGYYPDTKITDPEGDYLLINDDGSILTTTVPRNYKFYFHTVLDAPGVVAANNFLSVFNPAGSGKAITFFASEVRAYSVGAVSVGTSMTAFRTTAASGGTLIAAASVSRFVTSDPNPVAVVRVDNPTTTNVGLALNGFPPPISSGVGVSSAGSSAAPSGGGFTILPGEGLVATTSSGDIDQRWDITLTWAEFTI